MEGVDGRSGKSRIHDPLVGGVRGSPKKSKSHDPLVEIKNSISTLSTTARPPSQSSRCGRVSWAQPMEIVTQPMEMTGDLSATDSFESQYVLISRHKLLRGPVQCTSRPHPNVQNLRPPRGRGPWTLRNLQNPRPPRGRGGWTSQIVHDPWGGYPLLGGRGFKVTFL